MGLTLVTHKPLVVPLLILLSLLYGCGSSSTSEQSKPHSEQGPSEQIENKSKVADLPFMPAVFEYVRAHFPEWKVLGTTLDRTGVTRINVGVDLSSGEKRQTVSLVVRRFEGLDGKEYWKVEPPSPEIQALDKKK